MYTGQTCKFLSFCRDACGAATEPAEGAQAHEQISGTVLTPEVEIQCEKWFWGCGMREIRLCGKSYRQRYR